MTHKLTPSDGKSYLATNEVVRRLRDEFPVVEADAQQGREHVRGMVRRFLKAGAEETIDRLQKGSDEALMVVIADEAHSQDGKLRFAVIPGEPIIVGYWSGRHRRLAEPLLQRCSQALGYSIELV
jgi:hypothetical protein